MDIKDFVNAAYSITKLKKNPRNMNIEYSIFTHSKMLVELIGGKNEFEGITNSTFLMNIENAIF